MLKECSFSLTPWKSQQQIMDLVFGQKASEEKLYITSPPGSGKTITGLMIAVQMNVPTLVLVPNTAIQSQWIAKTQYFLPAGSNRQIASIDPEQKMPITVLTYQALAQTRDIRDDEKQQLMTAWKEELLEEGEDEDAAVAWLADYEKENPERFTASLLRRWKGQRKGLAKPDPKELVSEKAVELMKFFHDRAIGLVIFDECHHLLGYWAQVALALVENLEDPRVLGLTATPPAAKDLENWEIELHRELLHEVDYALPTPAVVKDGCLAPYQDLAYFTRPEAAELDYIRNCSKQLGKVLQMVEGYQGKSLADWLQEEIISIPEDSLASVLRRRAVFMSEAVRYLKGSGREVPRGLASLAEGDLSLEEKADLTGRYAARHLLVSKQAQDRQLYEELARAFRPLGFQLSEKGLKQCQSTVSRILALSQAKMGAMVQILSHELEQSELDVRAIVITDFERSSATVAKEISNLLTAESGGAIAAIRALTSNEVTDELDPILVTGQSVIVDDDLLPKFLAQAEKWLGDRNFSVALSSKQDGGFYHIIGRGSDWNTRNYVAMITEFFEQGLTRCLVGTRGLLGEGWDSLCANTLIDLTTAATEMTVNQLRGRAVRLDPAQPEKVANIWDVVCLAPEFEHGLSDYFRFARKHKGYYGICDDGAIEYGLGHIHPALTEAGPEDIALNAHVFNAEMEQRSRDRSKIRRDWKIGEPYENSEMISLELKVDESFDLRSVRGTVKKMKGYEISAGEKLKNICLAILRALQDLELLRDLATEIQLSERADRYFRIFLDTSSPDDMNLFTQCLDELFQPIEEQRYMIPRYEQELRDTWVSKLMPAILKFYFKRKINRIAVFHPLPECFGNSKKNAEIFSDKWNLYVSPGRAVFTKRGNGEQMLVEAKKQQQTVQNARNKIKSVWR